MAKIVQHLSLLFVMKMEPLNISYLHFKVYVHTNSRGLSILLISFSLKWRITPKTRGGSTQTKVTAESLGGRHLTCRVAIKCLRPGHPLDMKPYVNVKRETGFKRGRSRNGSRVIFHRRIYLMKLFWQNFSFYFFFSFLFLSYLNLLGQKVGENERERYANDI